MLPEPMKNTAETVVGTSTFTNIFVQMITSSNYWDQNNSIKPLMHTWYVGVIFQFYVFYPFIFMFAHRFSRNGKQTSFYVLGCIFLVMEKVCYRVGTKSWGYVNGNVYNNNRYGEGYFLQTVKIPKDQLRRNIDDRAIFGDKFIDLLSFLQNENKEISIFTPSKYFYTHDGLHLTKAGAIALAEILFLYFY